MGYVLDTDTISALQHGNRLVVAYVEALPPSELFVTIVSFEEQSAGRLSVLNRHLTGARLIEAYERLRQMLGFYASANILTYDDAAARLDDSLRSQWRRMGTKDRRIAAITFAHQHILVTHNTVDFGRVPGLTVMDWMS